ncbi:MAG: hypothetical protein PHS32_17395 [Rhodoferax sp.]|uniref:hypothetical protein n=1 Tax=Rhodoferax sp. TaxID=50421 RepID=UPI00262EFDE0|nr:hypothetical protein [Rhodoferax sp.]MDD5335509.1 hypothetical protein [Rhodoferax sp.]
MAHPSAHGVKPFVRQWHDTDNGYVVSYSPRLARVRNGWCSYPLTELEVLDLGNAYDAQSLRRALEVYHTAAQRCCKSMRDLQSPKFTRAFTREEAERCLRRTFAEKPAERPSTTHTSGYMSQLGQAALIAPEVAAELWPMGSQA